MNDGGAVLVRGSLTLSNDRFLGNAASAGGAVSVVTLADSDFLTITGCTFNRNTATGTGDNIDGGAIFVNSEFEAAFSISLTTFLINRAVRGNGGAVAVDNTGSLTINTCSFQRNTAFGGGAISAECAFVSVFGATDFTNNQARSRGGAIRWLFTDEEGDGSFSATSATFESNTAGRGGGVFLETSPEDGVVKELFVGCLFNNNEAMVDFGGFANDDGGGLYVKNETSDAGSALLKVINSTFVDNRARDNGGAIAVKNSNTGDESNTVSLTSLTVYQNSALGRGGGVFLETPDDEVADVWNSIFAGNCAPQGMDLFGVVHSLGHNFVGAKDGSDGWDEDNKHDQTGTNDNILNPGVDPGSTHRG